MRLTFDLKFLFYWKVGGESKSPRRYDYCTVSGKCYEVLLIISLLHGGV